VATAKIAYAEVYAGLTRRRREGSLAEKDYRLVCREFEADWGGYLRVDLRDDVLSLARDLIRRNPLRAADAVHLASALHIVRSLGEDVVFVAADSRLLTAARREKLNVLNPEKG
jgi:predicted nucleic acid-binding protein